MDRLSRLALMIRSSHKTSNVQSVLEYSRSRGPDGFDDLIMALIRWRFRSAKTENCQAQFGMPQSLQFQLGSSIIYRRNRLIYELKRKKTLEADRRREDVSETTISELPEDTQRIDLADEMKMRETDRISRRLPEAFPEGLNARSSPPKSLLQTILTGSMARIRQDDEATSYASTNCSINPRVAAAYPKAPEIPQGHEVVRCSICFKPQPRKIVNDEKLWRSVNDARIILVFGSPGLTS